MRQLQGFDFVSHPHVPFLWLKLPDPWLSGTFKNAAFRDGVLIDDEDEFKAARADKVYHRVRIRLLLAEEYRERVGCGSHDIATPAGKRGLRV